MQKVVTEMFADETQSLQEEIQALTQQYEENQQEITFLSCANIKETLNSYREKRVTNVWSSDAKSKDKMQIGQLEDNLQFLTTISGIEFTKYLKKTECKTENQTLYIHRLVGQCQSLFFQLEFQTMDSQVKGRECCNVTDLNIIMECGDHADLSKFISKTEERKNLLLFFRTLSKFSEWCEYRKRTFVQFKQKHPNTVEYSVGLCADYMVLKNPELPGFELLVVWKINVDEEGTVIPVLDLLTKIPEQALPFEMMTVLENAALGFRNLVQQFGIEGSIEKILQVIY